MNNNEGYEYLKETVPMKLFDPDREEVERLASSIERDTGRLLEMMIDRDNYETAKANARWLCLAELRLATMREGFTHDHS